MPDPKVIDLVKRGTIEPTLVALRTQKTYTEVTQDVQQITTPETNLQRLKLELNDAYHLLKTAKDEYKTDPSLENSTAYVQILREVQSLIKNIDNYNDPTKIADTVITITQRLITKVLQVVVEGFGAVREGVPAYHHADMDSALRKIAHDTTARYTTTCREISRALGADDTTIFADLDIEAVKSAVEKGHAK